MGETFEKLLTLGIIDQGISVNMKKAVGFRNIAVHGYEEIDYKILHFIINENLDDFKEFAKEVYTNINN